MLIALTLTKYTDRGRPPVPGVFAAAADHQRTSTPTGTSRRPTISAVDTSSTLDAGTGSVTLRNTLHQRGLRMTPQRQLVLDAVHDLGHATPEQICNQVQRSAPAVNITTVYRTLDLLERLGLVRHTHLGHGAPTYSEQHHQHVHLVCHSCGAVAEAPTHLMDDLAERLRADSGFTLDVSHVGLSGLCLACQGAPSTDVTGVTGAS